MLHILNPGPLLTIQDLGRPGVRRFGVPGGGALDRFAHAAANRLVGNTAGLATLEMLPGCQVRVEALAVVAVAGGDLGLTLDGAPLPGWQACLVRPGAVLHCARRVAGARAYLAVGGGIAVEPQLGSRSALVGGPFAAMLGRPLRAGDRLPLGLGDLSLAGRSWPATARPIYALRPELRYLPGPHALVPGLRRRFHAAAWQVSPQSNRMGFRLSGPALAAPTATLASLGVVPGAIQLPPDGAPIVLLADAQTTGGYPLLGAVIAADLPALAQTLPGDQVRFSTIGLAAAEQAWRDQARMLDEPFESEPEWGAPC